MQKESHSSKIPRLKQISLADAMSIIKSGTLNNDSQGKIIHTKIGKMIAIDYQPASIVDHDGFKHLSMDCSQEYF